MNISFFGLGYVGCVGMACLAKDGHVVIGVDNNQEKVDLINAGKPTIVEKDIDELINKSFEEGRISATHDYKQAVTESEVSMIAVGTPSSDKGHLDLTYLYKVAEEIGEALSHKDEFHTIVIRSTSFPGTNKKIADIVQKKSGKEPFKHFGVVSNPEFLREGSAVADYFDPPVTVIGSESDEAIGKVKELYSTLDAPLKIVDTNVAELIKYVNNTWHALKITFANEVGNICKQLDIDSHVLMDLFTMDTKLNLSPYYLKPGFAYGGSCLPKDLKGLQTISHDSYINTPVIESINKSNEIQKRIAIDLIGKYNKSSIGVLGLSFKAGTDDLRFSPIVEVIEYLLGKGKRISIYDHNVNLSKITGTNKSYIDQHIPHLSDLIYGNIDKVISSSDLIVITHKIAGIDSLIKNNRDKQFVDLVRATEEKYENCEGICW